MKGIVKKFVSFKLLVPVFLFLMNAAFMENEYKTVYYYKLMTLKKAESPRRIELINADNLSRGKSVVSRGILFTYKDRNASRVRIGGNFTSWEPKRMERSKDGVWYYFLSSDNYSGDVEYKFNIDGLWTEDPNNSLKKDDLTGAYVSKTESIQQNEGTHLSFRKIDSNTVEFRLYNPGARVISLVGDFNQWNPENDLMTTAGRGVWTVKKRLLPGRYRYKFIVDGNWKVDVYNPHSGTDSTGDICSVIDIR